MTALSFGYLLIALIVVAFFVNFINFQSRAQRQLQKYEHEQERLTEHLKREQRARENEQALIHKQTYIISEAEERIRRLEEKLVRLEDIAHRLEALSAQYDRLDASQPRQGEV